MGATINSISEKKMAEKKYTEKKAYLLKRHNQ